MGWGSCVLKCHFQLEVWDGVGGMGWGQYALKALYEFGIYGMGWGSVGIPCVEKVILFNWMGEWDGLGVGVPCIEQRYNM